MLFHRSMFFKNQRHPGFSLVEVLMEMVLLIIVTIPMLMMLNLQKKNIAENRQGVINKIMVDQVYDNFDPHTPDPVGTYNTGTYSTNNYYYSIYCDPESSMYSQYHNNQCMDDGSGTYDQLGPFFSRTVTTGPCSTGSGNQAICASVSLYKNRNSTGTPTPTPYYHVSREYQLDAYHLNVGAISTPVSSDSKGVLWYPEVTDTPPTFTTGTPPSNTYYVNSTASCSYNTAASATGVSIPFQTYRSLAHGSCQNGVYYLFRVIPNTTYSLNIYFVIPNGANIQASTAIASPSGSTILPTNIEGNIIIDSLKPDLSLESNLVSFYNYDVGIAAGGVPTGAYSGNSLPVVLQSNVVTSPNASFLRILVQPAGGATSVIDLSGISVIRRDDL